MTDKPILNNKNNRQNNKQTIEQIDALLPQTQCGLCSYDGCQPYAQAIVEQNEAINRCPPGGVAGLKKLANATGQDIEPYMAEMAQKQKPPMLALIREHDCIGCTKCIQACPVDAIMGAAKLMHTVIQSECTGCELCVAPCPVDCIDMIELHDATADYLTNKSSQFKRRYQQRNIRLAKEIKQKHKTHYQKKSVSTVDKKAAILAALNRKDNKI